MNANEGSFTVAAIRERVFCKGISPVAKRNTYRKICCLVLMIYQDSRFKSWRAGRLAKRRKAVDRERRIKRWTGTEANVSRIKRGMEACLFTIEKSEGSNSCAAREKGAKPRRRRAMHILCTCLVGQEKKRSHWPRLGYEIIYCPLHRETLNISGVGGPARDFYCALRLDFSWGIGAL